MSLRLMVSLSTTSPNSVRQKILLALRQKRSPSCGKQAHASISIRNGRRARFVKPSEQNSDFEPDRIVCGSGETEVISLIIRAFAKAGDKVLMYEPCFPIYHIFAENEGRVPVYVPMGPDFDLVVDRYIDTLKKTSPKIAFVTNPHSPSGKLMAEADIRRICEAAGDNTLVVLDEAYIHFTETPGSIALTRDHSNLIVLRTFSKAYGLAGLRLGFGIAQNKALISPLLTMKPTWNLGQMQIAGGAAAMADDAHVAAHGENDRRDARLRDRPAEGIEPLPHGSGLAQQFLHARNHRRLARFDASVQRAAGARCHREGLLGVVPRSGEALSAYRCQPQETHGSARGRVARHRFRKTSGEGLADGRRLQIPRIVALRRRFLSQSAISSASTTIGRPTSPFSEFHSIRRPAFVPAPALVRARSATSRSGCRRYPPRAGPAITICVAARHGRPAVSSMAVTSDILPLLWERSFDSITQSVASILSKRALPLIVGGDHSVTFPIVRAYSGHEPITVVQFDAHLDYRDDAGGVRYGHGNVLRRVRELPFVEQVVSLGIRSLRTRREDREAHAEHGNVLVPAWDIHTKGADGISDLLPRNRNVYVTFDIDALDPGIAPGTGTPEVGGLSYEQARRLLELIVTGNRLVGFDMVEVNPSLDVSQITALLGLQIMVETMGFAFSR